MGATPAEDTRQVHLAAVAARDGVLTALEMAPCDGRRLRAHACSDRAAAARGGLWARGCVGAVDGGIGAAPHVGGSVVETVVAREDGERCDGGADARAPGAKFAQHAISIGRVQIETRLTDAVLSAH